MALNSAATRQPYRVAARAISRPIEADAGNATYGGLVGQMISDLDARLGQFTPAPKVEESPEDLLHTISVICGYVGLAAGFAAAAAALRLLF